MSEQSVVDAPAVETAAPAAEQAAPETPVVEAPAAEAPTAEQPAAPMSRREARQAAREAARQAFRREPESTTPAEPAEAPAPTDAGPVADATGRLHDPATGKFVEKQGEQDTAAASRSETPSPEAAATPPKGEAATDAAAATPQSYRVEIPQDHPLREQGIDAITVSTPQEERAIRAALNSYTRRQEVEAVRAENAKLREEQMRREARDTATEKWKQTPEYQQAVEQYQSILETVGQDAASRYWAGMQESFRQLADAEYSQRQQAYEAQQTEQHVAQWKQEAWTNAGRLPEQIRSLPEFNRYFDEAFALFDAGLAKGLYADAQSPEQLHQEFARVFAAHLMLQPSVKAANTAIAEQERRRSAEAKAKADAEAAAKTRAEQERQRIEAEAVERYKREIAAKRQGAPPHPLAAVQNAVRTERTTISGEPEQPDTSTMTSHELRKQLRNGAREIGRAYLRQP